MTSIILGLSMMAMLVYLLPLATIISSLGILIIYIIVSYVSKTKLNVFGRQLSKGRDAVLKEIQEGLGGIREIILNNSQEKNINSYIKKDYLLRNASAKFISLEQVKIRSEALAMSLIIIVAFFSSLNSIKQVYLYWVHLLWV